MRLIISLLTGAVALGVASTAVAQDRTPAPRRTEREGPRVRITTPERCTTEDGNIECRIFRRADLDSVLMKRAVLGVNVNSTGSLRDTLGLFVSRVTPKGPAENAGIVEGDRIVSINGVDLRVNAADAEDSYANGLPGRRLTREVRKLTPGAVASLRVLSGGRVRDVQVTTGRASDLSDRGSFGLLLDGLRGGSVTFGDMPGFRMESFPRMRMNVSPRIRMENFDFDYFPKIELDVKRSEVKERQKKS